MASVGNTQIGAVRVEATLESGKFVDGAKKIRLETKKTETALKSSFSGMGAAIKGFGGAITAGLSIGLLAGLAKKALDFAAAIGTTAKQLGVTTKELQLFRHAAGQVGIKQAEADKGLERLGITLGKAAAGSATASKALAAVGVSLNDIQTKTRTEIFAQIADQMNKQGGAAKNAAAGAAIMGEGFTKLTPLLDKGSKGINELSQAAERLGIVLSDDQIQRADETAQKLEDVRAVLSAQIAGVVADNAASIVSLANALASLTSSIVNFLGSNPQAALGILGALAGARFGLPGAAAGGIAGVFAGGHVAAGARDANTDLRFRMDQVRKAKAEFQRTQKLYGGGPAGASDRARAEKELRRQTALLSNATASATVAPAAGGGAAIPQFLAPAAGGGGGRKRRAPKAPKDTSLRDAHQFDMEIRRAQMDVLRATLSLSTDYSERASLAVQMLDLEKSAHEAELQYRIASGDINATQAEQLRLEHDKTDALERQAIMADEAAQAAEDANRFQALVLDLDRDLLESKAQLAETADEQRKAQLEILDHVYRQRKAALDAAIATEKDAATIQRLTLQRDRLTETYANDREAVMRGTRGPLEEWAASIPQTAAQINEAFQSIQADGLEGLSDAIGDVITGTRSLKEAFGDLARSIIADIIRMTIRMLIFRAISGMLGGLGGSVSGSVSGGGSLGPIPQIPGMAAGGSLKILGNRGLDKNLMSMNGVPVAHLNYGEQVRVEPANDSSPAHVVLEINDPLLRAKIISGAVEVVGQAAPRIVRASVDTTTRAIMRPKLMGRG